MVITIGIPYQPNYLVYRYSVYQKFGTVMVIDFVVPNIWYGNRYRGFGTVMYQNHPYVKHVWQLRFTCGQTMKKLDTTIKLKGNFEK